METWHKNNWRTFFEVIGAVISVIIGALGGANM